MKRTMKILLVIFLLVIPFIFYFYFNFIKRQEGLNYKSQVQPVQVEFLQDLRYNNGEAIVHEAEIFTKTYRTIIEAEDFILLDYFLYNDDYDHHKLEFPDLSYELTEILLEKKEKQPEIRIVVLADPINYGYGSYTPLHFKQMMNAGIEVVQVNLEPVRDSNPLYSAYYRSYLKRVPQDVLKVIPNIFDRDKEKMTLAGALGLLNFKANHRKVLVTEKAGIIQSANPHDGSSLHSNIGFYFEGPLVKDLLESENVVLGFSGSEPIKMGEVEAVESPVQGQVVTEEAIKEKALEMLNKTEKGDQVDFALFYIGDRDLVEAIKEAADRGVNLSLMLDLNKDAFGLEKIGIPNKAVAKELEEYETIEIRYYKTHGEQFHSKMMVADYMGSHSYEVLGGSANFTRRNLANYNLETDLWLTMDSQDSMAIEIKEYFSRIKENQYSLAYEEESPSSWWQDVLYRIQEGTGLSTF